MNARCIETRIEVEGNGSVDSWETLELVCRKVEDRAIRAMCTENPGHAADHQVLGPGDGGNCSTGLVVYYESLKRELKTKTIYGFRCDERLKN